MTNDELRLAIAKAKGINAGVVKEWDDIYGEHHTHDYGGDREWYPAGTLVYYAENGVFYPLPNWPEDNGDAMTLMQEAADQNVYVTLFYSRHEKKWVARFHRTQTTAHADTLARAVSEAYHNWQTMDDHPRPAPASND